MIGRTLSHYRIVEKIGAGGMGVVYRAHDERLHRDVAIKVLPEALAADPERLARLEREARTVAGLNHPNIVVLHSIEEEGAVRFLTMELVEGQDLAALITPPGMPVARILDLAIPLADALTAAHDHGVVHRDLKPGNVKVTPEGRVKVLDFGLAKAMQAGPAPDAAPTPHATPGATPDASRPITAGAELTDTGLVAGTVPYMAPEQLRGEEVDPRTDLFALGVLLYEISTGTRPFTGRGHTQVMASILRAEPVPLNERRADLPRELGRIVRRCLAKEPKRRYQTARDLRNDLEDLQREVEWGHGSGSRRQPAPWVAPPTTSEVGADASTATTLSVADASVFAALTAYRETRIREWTQPRYRLDREFVALTLLVDQGAETPSGRWSAQPESYRDLGELLERVQDPAVVVLGPPGCGKSTLLRRLELDLAQRGLRDPDQPLTVFVQLNQYRGGTRGEPAPAPMTWLAERWARAHPDLPSLPELLRTRRVVLLLDALNEMPTASAGALQEAVLAWKDFLAETANDHPEMRAVFSCRTLDYSAPLSTPRLRVPQVLVEPLTDAQVEQFLEKHSPDLGPGIWAQLKGTPQLEPMRSPYFLSLLVEQVEPVGVVPEGLAGLFTGFVRQALRREVEQGNPLFLPDGLLTDRDVRRVTQWTWDEPWDLPERGVLVPKLSELAFALQAQSGGGGQVRAGYDEALGLLNHERADEIIRAGVALSVLDEDPRTEEVLFAHQLVQEYFAGRWLARAPDPECVRAAWKESEVRLPLRAILETLPPGETIPPLDTTGWEETAVLGAAMAAAADDYVRDLMETNLVVAGRAAGQVDVRSRLAPALLGELRSALAGRSRDRAADLRSRIAAGLALGPLGDPRFAERTGPDGACLVPPVVTIPAGRYPMGEDEALEYGGHRIEAHMPRHVVDVAAFRIAAFPVTNAEWARFMASGGYEDPRWWDTAGARRWRSGEGTAEGIHVAVRHWLQQFRDDPERLESTRNSEQWPEAIYERWKKRLAMTEAEFEGHLRELYPGGSLREPLLWRDARFNNPLQPVVGICWYEARAYANWLSEQTGEPYRLPTEAEWEAAARGTQARQYAWGDEFGPLLGNTADTKVRGTTPVGIFVEGDTPEGVSDLSGNAQEWTGSMFGGGMDFCRARFAYPYDPTDGREDPEAGPDIRRVVRGGAWGSGHAMTRAMLREEAHPGYRSSGHGARLAAGAVSGP